jgi:hypothetical protein
LTIAAAFALPAHLGHRPRGVLLEQKAAANKKVRLHALMSSGGRRNLKVRKLADLGVKSTEHTSRIPKP